MKLVLILAVLAILVPLGRALDYFIQQEAVNMYSDWLPGSTSVKYRDPVYDRALLIQHLQAEGNRMRVAEMPATPTHRMFLMPLNLYLEHQNLGLGAQYNKNHFAVFVMSWQSEVAVFEGIGAINGISRKKLADRLIHGVDLFLPMEYGITLHTP